MRVFNQHGRREELVSASYIWLVGGVKKRRPREYRLSPDLFEIGCDGNRDLLFAGMAVCPQHMFFVSTQHSDHLWEYLTARERALSIDETLDSHFKNTQLSIDGGRKPLLKWPLTNVRIGLRVSNLSQLATKVDYLYRTPAVSRALVFWPLSEDPGDIRSYIGFKKYAGNVAGQCVNIDGETWHQEGERCQTCGWGYYNDPDRPGADGINWVQVYGDAKPVHPKWVQAIRDQCVDAGVPFWFRGWGAWSPYVTGAQRLRKKSFCWTSAGTEYKANEPDTYVGSTTVHRVGIRAAGRMLDGRTWEEAPP